jgi:hypothetical protein
LKPSGSAVPQPKTVRPWGERSPEFFSAVENHCAAPSTEHGLIRHFGLAANSANASNDDRTLFHLERQLRNGGACSQAHDQRSSVICTYYDHMLKVHEPCWPQSLPFSPRVRE